MATKILGNPPVEVVRAAQAAGLFTRDGELRPLHALCQDQGRFIARLRVREAFRQVGGEFVFAGYRREVVLADPSGVAGAPERQKQSVGLGVEALELEGAGRKGLGARSELPGEVLGQVRVSSDLCEKRRDGDLQGDKPTKRASGSSVGDNGSSCGIHVGLQVYGGSADTPIVALEISVAEGAG